MTADVLLSPVTGDTDGQLTLGREGRWMWGRSLSLTRPSLVKVCREMKPRAQTPRPGAEGPAPGAPSSQWEQRAVTLPAGKSAGGGQ